ncbi:hypothetical protein KAW64_03695, partial [bacterium]|nr:hypothetical protein [bacterium]
EPVTVLTRFSGGQLATALPVALGGTDGLPFGSNTLLTIIRSICMMCSTCNIGVRSVRISYHNRFVICLFTCTVLLASGLCATTRGTSLARRWLVPVLVGLDDKHDSISPGVATSDDGAVWFVWSTRDSVDLDSEIAYVVFRDSIWSEQALLHEANSGMDRIPVLSMGTDGMPWVIWQRHGDGYEQVVSHSDGTAWTTPETVLTRGGRYDWYTIHARDRTDVWVARDSRFPDTEGKDILLRHYDGAAWGEEERLGFDAKSDVCPVVVSDEKGRAWVAWLCLGDAGAANIVCAARRDSDGWSEPVVVDTSPGNIVMCDIELCPDGMPLVAWVGNGQSTACDVKYAVCGDRGWEYGGLINEVDDPHLDDDKNLQLSQGGGELWAIWRSMVSGGHESEIVCARWSESGWSPEERVSVPDTARYRWHTRPQLDVSSEGAVWAVWERVQDSAPYDHDIFAASRNPTESGR